MPRSTINEPMARKILSLKYENKPDGSRWTAEDIGVSLDVSPHEVWAIWSGRRWSCLGDPRQVPSPRPRVSVETVRQIMNLEKSLPADQVAAKTGVSKSTVYSVWRRDPRYADLIQQVTHRPRLVTV